MKFYNKLIFWNLTFFGILAALFYFEDILYHHPMYSFVGLFIIFPSLIIYPILYGVFSYKQTRKIILPNIILFLFVYGFSFIVFFIDKESAFNFPSAYHSAIIRSTKSTLLSLLASFIAKFVKERKED